MSLCNSNRVLIIQASYHVTTRTLDQREAKRAHFYNSIHNHSKKRSYINLCMEMICLWKKRPWYSILISNRNQKTMGNCISSIRNKMVIKSIQHRFVETKHAQTKKHTLTISIILFCIHIATLHYTNKRICYENENKLCRRKKRLS